MPSIFNKVKGGISDAGSKAKTVVEINKLKAKITEYEKEIGQLFLGIGESVYEAFEKKQISNIEDVLKVQCLEVLSKKEEIRKTDVLIKRLNDEKECPTCNKIVALSVKFCESCGHKFEEVEEETIEEAEEESAPEDDNTASTESTESNEEDTVDKNNA